MFVNKKESSINAAALGNCFNAQILPIFSAHNSDIINFIKKKINKII